MSLLYNCVNMNNFAFLVNYFELVITSARNEQRKINQSIVLAKFFCMGVKLGR